MSDDPSRYVLGVEEPFPYVPIAIWAVIGVVLAGVGGVAAVLFTDTVANRVCQ